MGAEVKLIATATGSFYAYVGEFYGLNVTGYGATPAKAMSEFEEQWHAASPSKREDVIKAAT